MNASHSIWGPPLIRRHSLRVWRRNFLVWRKLFVPAVLMNFGEPLIYLFGFGLGLGAFIVSIEGVGYLPFLATGIMASATLTTSAFEGMYSVYTRMDPQRTYESILATPLTIDDIILGELLWCASKATLSGAAILVISLFAGWVEGIQALLVLPVFFLLGLSIAGLSILMSAFARGYDFFQYFFTLGITPMLMLSGVFFPISQLPATVQNIVLLTPLPHAVELIRAAALGSVFDLPPESILLHLLVLTAYSAFGLYLGLVGSRKRFRL